MNLNFDFSKLNISFQFLLVGIIFLMPVFYFDLYYFDKTNFHLQPLYLTIIKAYVISLGWLLMSSFLGLTYILGVEDRNKMPVQEIVGYGVAISLLLALIINGVTYLNSSEYRIKSFCVNLLIGQGVGYLTIATMSYRKYRDKKRKKQLEIEFPEARD